MPESPEAPEAETIFVKPAADRRVRHPDGRLLEDAGELVTHDAYWARRLLEEDVVEAKPARSASAPAAPPAQKKEEAA